MLTIRTIKLVCSHPGVIHDLRSGKSDMTLILKHPDLIEHVIAVDKVTTIKVLILNHNMIQIQSLSDLYGKKLGGIRNSAFAREIYTHKQIIPTILKDNRQGLKLLKLGRIDALVGVDMSIYYAMKKLNITRDQFSQPFIYKSMDVMLLLSNKVSDPELEERLRTALNSMKKDGTLNKIFEGYIGKSLN